MQAVHDIFAIWGPDSPHIPLAAALNEKQDTVYRWLVRKRIPESAWTGVIQAAEQKGAVLTIADMHAANAPRKRRGAAVHKIKPLRRRRRAEMREST